MSELLSDLLWRVHYQDGSIFDERDADGMEHGFGEVDLARVHLVELWSADGAQYLVRIDPTHQRPIFFRRQLHVLPLGVGGPVIPLSVPVLGWQDTIEGHNIAHYTAIFAPNMVFMTTDHDELYRVIHQYASRLAQ